MALTLVAGLSYFYAHRGLARRHFINTWDLYHYYLGPKYFNELGHTGLYEATVVAARQARLGLKATDPIRDLNDYSGALAGRVKNDNEYVRRFTPERWRDFRAAVVFFHVHAGPEWFRRMILDHGYNGTPVLTLFGSPLAHLVPVGYASLSYLALLDIVLLLVGFALITRSFGWQAGLMFTILFCVSFTSRFTIVGASLLRYTWLAALTIGLALIHLRRHFAGGVFMALSCLLNVFPILFTAGIAIKGLVEVLWRRRLCIEYRRFAVGFALTGIVLVGLSLSVGRGLDGWRSFMHQMQQHAERLTTSRVGFQYLFVYEGEGLDGKKGVTYSSKRRKLEQLKPWLMVGTGLMLLLCAVVACQLDDARACILFGIVAIFLLFSLVQYYWAMMHLLMLLWRADANGRPAARGETLGQLLLFVMTGTVFLTWWGTRHIGFVNNTVMSGLLALYLAYVMGYFAYTTGVLTAGRRRLQELLAR
jgi:hypothetical protein